MEKGSIESGNSTNKEAASDGLVEVSMDRLVQGIEAGDVDSSTLSPGLQDVLGDDTNLQVGMGFNSAFDSTEVDT